MKRQGFHCLRSSAPEAQSGAVVIVVMVLMMLAVLTALGTSRAQWLSERAVGSEADMQRALAAAEALIADAELDIRGLRFDGTPCSTDPANVGCRNSKGGRPYFPLDLQDFHDVAVILQASGKLCTDGICMPASPAVWTPAYLKAQAATLTQPDLASTYGRFTGASAQAAGHPLLSSATPRAWYWVEVFLYNAAGESSQPVYGIPRPDTKNPVVFRITVHVQGLRPATRVWLRTVVVLKDNNF